MIFHHISLWTLGPHLSMPGKGPPCSRRVSAMTLVVAHERSTWLSTWNIFFHKTFLKKCFLAPKKWVDDQHGSTFKSETHRVPLSLSMQLRLRIGAVASSANSWGSLATCMIYSTAASQGMNLYLMFRLKNVRRIWEINLRELNWKLGFNSISD